MHIRNIVKCIMSTSLMIALIGGVAYASSKTATSSFTYVPGDEDSVNFVYTPDTFQKEITLERSGDYWIYGNLDSNEEQTVNELILPLKKDDVVEIKLSSGNDIDLSVGIIENEIKTAASSPIVKTGDSVKITAPKDGTYKVFMKNNKNVSSNFALTVSYK